MSSNRKNQQAQVRGFTLIELLVVIAIMALLSSIMLAALGSARSKARDAARTAGIRQIRTALELFYDAKGHYIISGHCGATQPNGGWANSVECLAGGHWLRDASTTDDLSDYFTKDPIDPINKNVFVNGAYYYFSANNNSYGPVGSYYVIVYNLENPNPVAQNCDFISPSGYDFCYLGSGPNVVTLGGRQA